MFALIDTTHIRALARHSDYMACAALAYIQFANIGTTIVPLATRRELAQFNEEEMAKLAASVGLKVAGIPTGEAYSALLKQVHAQLCEAPWLELPVSKDVLIYQAESIPRTEDKPRCLTLPTACGGSPEAGELPVPGYRSKWAVEPQRNVRRCDSSYGTFFNNDRQISAKNHHSSSSARAMLHGRNSAPQPTEENHMAAKKSPGAKAAPAPKKNAAPAKKPAAKKPETKKAPATKPPTKKAAPAPKAPKAPKEPKAPREGRVQQNGITKPAPGGNTGNVWETADVVMAKKGSTPTYAEVDAVLEKKWPDMPTATRRTQYAAWRKFNGITGRVA